MIGLVFGWDQLLATDSPIVAYKLIGTRKLLTFDILFRVSYNIIVIPQR